MSSTTHPLSGKPVVPKSPLRQMMGSASKSSSLLSAADRRREMSDAHQSATSHPALPSAPNHSATNGPSRLKPRSPPKYVAFTSARIDDDDEGALQGTQNSIERQRGLFANRLPVNSIASGDAYEATGELSRRHNSPFAQGKRKVNFIERNKQLISVMSSNLKSKKKLELHHLQEEQLELEKENAASSTYPQPEKAPKRFHSSHLPRPKQVQLRYDNESASGLPSRSWNINKLNESFEKLDNWDEGDDYDDWKVTTTSRTRKHKNPSPSLSDDEDDQDTFSGYPRSPIDHSYVAPDDGNPYDYEIVRKVPSSMRKSREGLQEAETLKRKLEIRAKRLYHKRLARVVVDHWMYVARDGLAEIRVCCLPVPTISCKRLRRG
eukprot:TRINITY_DN4329_c0_g1_i2.p1 TRINITY_DN4329_c0_g1~~TRINITY_DN4329_c0_g1_i2.p1  ORF type:complete len:379 (-),score=74.23 TRINITY_DN4329_c0_g1_i2:36-1172(-)